VLDTDICSAHIRRHGGIAHRFIPHSARLYVPTIVLAALYSGATRRT
jgi:tRNA(fMet)-specific endonuclease VapC